MSMMGSRARTLPSVSLSEASPSTARVLAVVNAGHLTTTRSDLQKSDLCDLLVSFYAAIADDPLLAPYFASVDMGVHLPRIVAFWSTMLFHTGQYSGNAFRPHQSMPGLTADHFVRWVATLEHTVDTRFAGENADRMKDLAHRIAYSMRLRLGITPSDD